MTKKNKRPHNEFSLELLEKRLMLSAESALLGAGAEAMANDPQAQLIVNQLNDDQFSDPLAMAESTTVNEQDACDSLQEGLSDLRGILASFGKHFDLSSLNIPILPTALDQVFDFTATLANKNLEILPDIGGSTSLEALADALHGAGYSVLGVLNGIDGKYEATENGSLIEVSINQGPQSSVGKSGSYTGSLFNNDSESLLQGLSSEGESPEVSADWGSDLEAHLTLQLSFGVDAEGQFFVRTGGEELNIQAAFNSGVAATLLGSANLSGENGVSLSGNAHLGFSISLKLPDSTADTVKVDALGQLLEGQLIEAIEGDAGLQLNFEVGSSFLTFTADYHYDSEAAPTQPTISLEGEMTLPGVTVQGSDSDARLVLDGAMDFSTNQWNMTVTAKDGETLVFHEVELSGFSATMTISPDGFSGTTQGKLAFDFIEVTQEGVRQGLSLDFAAHISNEGFQLHAEVNNLDLHFQQAKHDSTGNDTGELTRLFDATEVTLIFDFKAQFSDSSQDHARFSFFASEADILQGEKFSAHASYANNNGKNNNQGISGAFDLIQGSLDFTVDQFQVEDEQVFAMTAASVAFHYDRRKSGPQTLMTVSQGTLKLLSFSNHPEMDLNSVEEADGTVIPGFTLYSNGFDIADLEVTLDAIHIGNDTSKLLEAGYTQISFEQIQYRIGSVPTGTVELKVDTSVRLLPGNENITCELLDSDVDADAVALQGSVNIATGAFSISADKLHIQIPDLLDLHTDGTTASPGIEFGFDPSQTGEQSLFNIGDYLLTLEPFKVKGESLEVTGSGIHVSTEALDIDSLVIPGDSSQLGEIHIGNGKSGDAYQNLFSITDPQIILSQIHLSADDLSGTVDFHAKDIDVLPDDSDVLCTASDTDNDGRAFDARLSIGTSGLTDFSLSVDKLDIKVSDYIDFTLVDGTFSPYQNIVFSEQQLDVVLDEAGMNISGQLEGLKVHQNGSFGVIGIEVDVAGLNNKIGLAGILPLVIDSFELKTDDGTLNNIEFAVEARFDIGTMTDKLPFTPILKLSNPEGGSTTHGENDSFNFDMAWRNGSLTPIDTPTITLGIRDLKVGDLVEFDGTLTLGGYVDGSWSGEFGGELRLKANEHISNLEQGTDPKAAAVSEVLALLGDSDEGLTVEIDNSSDLDITGGVIDIQADLIASFDLKDFLHFENLDLGFHFKASFDLEKLDFTIDVLGLTGASFTRASISLEEVIEIVATDGQINLAAKAGENIASFTSVTASIDKLGIFGSIDDLAINHSGDLVAQKDFAIELEFDPAESSLFSEIKFPSWLPTPGKAALTLQWPDFNADHEDFKLVFSADMTGLVIPDTNIGLSGSLDGLVLEIDDGSFRMDSLEKLQLQIEGDAFGVDVGGGFSVGMYQFDKDGKLIDPNNPEQLDTPVAERVLFGTADVELDIEGYGLNFFLGFSDYELFAYIYAGAPLDVGLETGIEIKELFAQVRTNPGDLDSVTQAKDLANITLADNQTATEKTAAFETSLIRSVQAGDRLSLTEIGKDLSELSIEGGIVINDLYTQSLAQITLDLRIDGGNRLLATGMLNGTEYGDLALKLYIDMSKAAYGQDHEAGSILIYSGMESSLLSTPPVILYGELSAREQHSGKGQAELTLKGGVIFSLDGAINVELEGSSTFSASSDRLYQLNVNGDVKVTGFGKAIALDGDLYVEVDEQGQQQIYGALAIEPKHFDFLDQLGVDSNAVMLWQLNFTESERDVVLKVGDNAEQTYHIQERSISTHIEGLLTIRESGKDWIGFHGSADLFATEESVTDAESGEVNTVVDLILDGELLLGPASSLGEGASSDDAWLQLDVLGFLRLEPLYGLAGQMTVSLKDGGKLKEVLGNELSVQAEFVLQLNTLLKDVEYTIPTQYPDLVDSGTIQLSASAPEILGGAPDATPTAWMYLALSDGSLMIHETTSISGSVAMVLAGTRSELLLDNAQVQVMDGEGSELLAFEAQGTLQVDEGGAYGQFTANLDQLGSSGAALSGTASWFIDTRGGATEVPGETLNRIVLDGELVINEPADNLIRLPGHHVLELITRKDGPGYHLELSSTSTLIIEAGGETLFELGVSGAGYVNDTGLAAILAYHPSDSVEDAFTGNYMGNADLSYALEDLNLGLNTTASDLAVVWNVSNEKYDFIAVNEGDVAPADTAALLPSLVGAQVNAGGTLLSAYDIFELRGDFTFTVNDNLWSIKVDGAAQLYLPDRDQLDVNDPDQAYFINNPLLDLSFDKTLTLELPGIVFSEQLSLSDADRNAVEGLLPLGGDLDYSLNFVVNTTKDAYPDLDIAAGPFVEFHLSNALWEIAGFHLSGDFHFKSTALSSLNTSADFKLRLVELGETLVSADLTGDFHLGFDGVAGRIAMDRPEFFGLEFQASDQGDEEFFYFEFNTSAKAYDFENAGETVTIEAGPYAVAHAHSTFNFLNLETIVLKGDFDLSKDGQMDLDVDLEAYLLSKVIDDKPLLSIPLLGSLTHNGQVTEGSFSVEFDTSEGGLDFPDDWGISFGKTSNELSISFTLNHDSSSSNEDSDAGKPADGPPPDSFQIVYETRTVLGLNQINGTAYFTWQRGKDFMLGLDGSSYIGFGALNSEGKPETVLLGVDLGGYLDVDTDGFYGGFEVELQAGNPEVLKFFEDDLGMKLGLDASLKAYLFVNTTGNDQVVEGMPENLSKLPGDRKFEILIDTTLEIASIEMTGLIGFTLFDDGFLVRVDASHELALYDSQDAHGTHLSLGGSTIAGVLEVHHSGDNKGVIGFLAGEGHAPTVNLDGFQLFKDELDVYFRINTTGQAVDLSSSEYLPDLSTVSDGIKSLLNMPEGRYGQIIVETQNSSPPLIGVEMDGTVIAEYVNADNVGKALFLYIDATLYWQLADSEGVKLGETSLEGDLFGLIDSDHNVALSGSVSFTEEALSSKFFGLDIGLPSVGQVFQLKTQNRSLDLTPFVPEHFIGDNADILKFDEGQYIKLITDINLEEKAFDIGFSIDDRVELEFKHEKVAGSEDRYHTWFEAESTLDATTYLTSLIGSISEELTVGLYIGSDGFALVSDYEYKDNQHAAWADINLYFNQLRVSVNTTGRELTLDNGSVIGANYAELVTGATLNVDLFNLQGKFDFYLTGKESDFIELHWSPPTAQWGPPDSEAEAPSDEVMLEASSDATNFEVFGQRFTFEKPVLQLHSDGLIAALEVNEDLDLSPLYHISGDFLLEINTTGRTITGFDHDIPPHTAALAMRNALLSIGSARFSGDLYLKEQDGELKMDIPDSNPLTASIAGLSEVQFSGWIADADFSLAGKVTIGDPDIASLDATVSVEHSHGEKLRFEGDLKLFGRTIKTVSESFDFDDHFSLELDLNESISLPNDFVKVSGDLKLHISESRIVINPSRVDVKVHDAGFSDQIEFSLDTAQGKWHAKGAVSISSHEKHDVPRWLYDAVRTATTGNWDTTYLDNWYVDFSFRLDFDLSESRDSVSYDVSGHAGVNYHYKKYSFLHHEHNEDHSFSISISDSGSVLIEDSKLSFDIKVEKWGVTLIDKTVHVNLDQSGLVKFSDIQGSLVYLDTNNNRILDVNEPFTHVDEEGRFDFSDEASMNPLGLLAPFDTNADGKISPDEGVFILQGGEDIHTGLENLLQYVVSAERYGDVFQDVYSPLAAMHHQLTNQYGMESGAAWDRLKAAFGIAHDVDLSTFDPNWNEANRAENAYHHDVEAAYAQVNALLINGFMVLSDQYPEHSAASIQASLLDQLCRKLAQYEVDGNEMTETLLEEASEVESILRGALSELEETNGAAESAEELLLAAVHVITVQNEMISLLRMGEVEHITESLAQIKQEAQLHSAEVLIDITHGSVDAAAFVASYDLDYLRGVLNASDYPLGNQAAILGELENLSMLPGEWEDIPLSVIQFDGFQDAIDWQLSSDNPQVMASENMQVFQDDSGQWFLRIQPDGAMRGRAQVSLTAIEESGNASNTVEFQLELLSEVRFGSIQEHVDEDGAWLEVTVETDQLSTDSIKGVMSLGGTVVQDTHYPDGSNAQFLIEPGESSTVFRIPILKLSYGSSESISLSIEQLYGGRLVPGASTLEYTLAAVSRPGYSQLNEAKSGFTARSTKDFDAAILRDLQHPEDRVSETGSDEMAYQD